MMCRRCHDEPCSCDPRDEPWSAEELGITEEEETFTQRLYRELVARGTDDPRQIELFPKRRRK